MKEKLTLEKVRILKKLGFDINAPTIYDAAKFLREEWGADLVVSPKFYGMSVSPRQRPENAPIGIDAPFTQNPNHHSNGEFYNH